MRVPLSITALAVAVLLAGCSDGGGGDDDGDAGDDGGASPGGSSGPTGTTSPTGGSMSGTGAVAPPQTVTLEVSATGAYPVNPAFTPSTASVPAGAVVQVTFRNEDSIPLIDHNWVVEGIADASSDVIAPGEESSFEFMAPATPGSFPYYCSIGDHRDRGMEGTLTVA